MSEEAAAVTDTPSIPKLDVPEVLRDAMALLRAHESLFVGAATACALPGFVLGTLGEALMDRHVNDVALVFGDSVVLGPDGATRLLALFVFATVCGTTGVMLGIGALAALGTHRGVAVAYESIVRASLVRVVPLTCIGAIVVLGTLLGMGCTCAGVVVPAFAAMAPAACVVERRGPIAAIERGIDLANGNFLPIFGLASAMWVPPVLVWFLLATFAAHDDLVKTTTAQAASSLTSGVASCFGAAILGVVYTRVAAVPPSSVSEKADVFA